MKVLFVCSRNKRRSRTAENIFKNHRTLQVKSAGFSNKSPVKISLNLLLWADLVLLMEHEHAKRLKSIFGEVQLPKVEVLGIKDKFEFMDEALIALIYKKVDTLILPS